MALRTSATATEVLVIRVDFDDKTASAGMRRIEKNTTRASHALEEFRRRFWGVFRALVSFYVIQTTILQFGNLAKQLISVNEQIELMAVRMAVLSGSAKYAERMIDFLEQLTITTPFVITDLFNAAVSLRAFGLDAEKVLPKVADWAAATGRDVNELAVRFGKLALGSPRVRQLLTTAALSQRQFQEALRETGEEGEALAIIIEKAFGGMTDATAKTFHGFRTNIQDEFIAVMRRVGEVLFVLIKQRLGGLYEFLEDQIENNKSTFRVWAEYIGAAFLILENRVVMLYGAFREFYEGVATGMNNLLGIVGPKGVLFAMAVLFRRIAINATLAAVKITFLVDVLRAISDPGKALDAVKKSLEKFGLWASYQVSKLTTKVAGRVLSPEDLKELGIVSPDELGKQYESGLEAIGKPEFELLSVKFLEGIYNILAGLDELDDEFKEWLKTLEGVKLVLPDFGELGGLLDANAKSIRDQLAILNAWANVLQPIVTAFDNMLFSAKKLRDVLKDILQQFVRIMLRWFLLMGISKAIGAPFGAMELLRHTVGLPITGAQHGFHGYVNQPTMFMAGEAGRERVDITPRHKTAPLTINIHGDVYDAEGFYEKVRQAQQENARRGY